ncbi:MAG: FKBP-type peptidyl-prolyl cis-trans isomerase [Leucobacter sp.]
MKLSHALLPAALVGALLVSGCSGGSASNGSASAEDAAGEQCLSAGEASDAVEVKGDVGSGLELTSKTPVKAEDLQRTVLEEGKGKTPEDGQQVTVAMTMFNGTSGETVQEAPESSTPFAKDSLFGWAYDGLRCAVPGQQVAIVAPFEKAFEGYEPADLGFTNVEKTDSLVIVMQIGEITEAEAAADEPGTLDADKLLKKAEGAAQEAPEGFPSVELAEDGSPTITMPEGVEPPKELSIATLIEGDGEEVQPGDRVYVNYRGVIWRTGEEFDSSWSRGEATDFLTTEVIGGFQQALEGQKVGSQVISVVPADDGGYGSDWLTSNGYEADDVMVFVLDILGTVHAE